MKILISAAEASSDVHGAELLRALKKRIEPSDQVSAFGVGGPKLQGAGLRSYVDTRELLVMGFFEILTRLPRIVRALKVITRAADAEKPDIAIVIDYPDFHFRLARRLRRLGIPVVYFIPPKVWVWRKSRVQVLKELFSKVLCVFPFEEAFFRKEGLSVSYVGNPLLDELPLHRTREEARGRLAIEGSDPVLLLMPGSRPSELKWHLTLMLESALKTAQCAGTRLKVLVPFPETAPILQLKEQINAWQQQCDPERRLELRISQSDAADCMLAADAGLIKSGTSTLEAALLGCPHAVVYKTNPVTAWIYNHFVRYAGPVGLVNLVFLGGPGSGAVHSKEDYLAREILLDEVTSESLADEALQLLKDETKRTKMRQGFRRLREILFASSSDGVQVSPSAAAAAEIANLVECSKAVREKPSGELR